MNDIIQILGRTFASFIVLLALTRVMGCKQVSELTFFDYITGISIGTIAGSISFDTKTNLILGLSALIFWTLFNVFSGLLALRSIPARKIINSEPIVVIREGQILENTLADQYYNINNLLMQLREQEVFDPTEVKLGILETDGKLSILKNPQSNIQSNPLPTQVGMSALSKELIIDGKLVEKNLSELNISKEWVDAQLKQQGVTDIHNVSLAMFTPTGKLYVDKKQDFSSKTRN